MTHYDPQEPPIEWHQNEASGPLALVAIVLFIGSLALWADIVSSVVSFTQ